MNDLKKPSKAKLLVACALLAGAAIFLYVSYLGPELAKRRAMLESQKAAAAQEWEEGKTITGEPMPSPELATAYLQAQLAATFEKYEVVGTNIIVQPRHGGFSIQLDSSSAVGAVLELADPKTSVVEKQLAREALASSGRERSYVSSTNYTCELKVRHFSPRKENGKSIVLMSSMNLSTHTLRYSALESKWEEPPGYKDRDYAAKDRWKTERYLRPEVFGIPDFSHLPDWERTYNGGRKFSVFGGDFWAKFQLPEYRSDPDSDAIVYKPAVYDYIVWKHQQQFQLRQNFVLKNLQGFGSRLPTWSPENWQVDSPELSAETVESLCAKLAASPNAAGATLINTNVVACFEFSRGMPRVGSDAAGRPWSNEGQSDVALALKLYVLIGARK
jgi:hypothetical protein